MYAKEGLASLSSSTCMSPCISTILIHILGYDIERPYSQYSVWGELDVSMLQEFSLFHLFFREKSVWDPIGSNNE